MFCIFKLIGSGSLGSLNQFYFFVMIEFLFLVLLMVLVICKFWLVVIKFFMYMVVVVFIIVGLVVVYGFIGQWYGDVFIIFLLLAIVIIVWINLSNDVFDSDMGIDVCKVYLVVNLIGNCNLVFLISNFFLLVGVLGLMSMSW